MKLVKSGPPPKPHKHVNERCEECVADGYSKGHTAGLDEGYYMGLGQRPDPDTVREWEARALEEAAKDAHRRAGHGGRWEVCGDIVCSALERFVHERTRPSVSGCGPHDVSRMVAG